MLGIGGNVLHNEVEFSSAEVLYHLKTKDSADIEAFIQVMNGLDHSDKTMDKLQAKLDGYEQHLEKLEYQKDKMLEELEQYEKVVDIHQRISDKEEIHKLQISLAEKNDYIKTCNEEIGGVEEELGEIQHSSRTNLLQNAETIMSFILEDLVATKKTTIGFEVDTHTLNPIKAEIASILYRFKINYAKDSYIKDDDSSKQRFIRLIENVVLKPNGEIIKERLDELYDVYNNWKTDQSIGMGEIIEWLYNYNVFDRAEMTTAKREVLKDLDYSNLFNKKKDERQIKSN